MKSSGQHILVVDDDPEVQVFLKRLLTSRGHRVTAVSSGDQALQILKGSAQGEENIRLILSDMNMPDMNGLALVKKLKELHSQIPIIIITAFGTIESAIEAIRNNAFDYLLKPIKIDSLLAAVDRAVEA